MEPLVRRTVSDGGLESLKSDAASPRPILDVHAGVTLAIQHTGRSLLEEAYDNSMMGGWVVQVTRGTMVFAHLSMLGCMVQRHQISSYTLGQGRMPWYVKQYSYDRRTHVTVIEASDEVVQDFIMTLNRTHRDFSSLGVTRRGSVSRFTFEAPYMPEFDRRRHPSLYYRHMYDYKVAKAVRSKHGKLKVTVSIGDVSPKALARLRADGLRIASVDGPYGFVRGSIWPANLRHLIRSINVVFVEDITWDFKGPFGQIGIRDQVPPARGCWKLDPIPNESRARRLKDPGKS